MSKKEFYETYIKDNRSEDEKMMEIIHSNAQKHKYDKYAKKDNKIKIWGIYGLVATIFMAIGILIGALWVK